MTKYILMGLEVLFFTTLGIFDGNTVDLAFKPLHVQGIIPATMLLGAAAGLLVGAITTLILEIASPAK